MGNTFRLERVGEPFEPTGFLRPKRSLDFRPTLSEYARDSSVPIVVMGHSPSMTSIYRSSFRSAVQTANFAGSQPKSAMSEAQLRAAAALNEEGRRRRSKAEPSNAALPRTMAWAARLPREVQPEELMRSFGRIANLLAANWDNADATVAYLHELLVDTRGCRSGFPPKVASELLALQRYYALSVAWNK